MSLALAVCVCAWLAPARAGRRHRVAAAAAVVLFFGFLFRDERVLSGVEAQISRAVAQVPAGQRVVAGFDDPYLRAGALSHLIDRACVGHCFSYANYEPSTGQFRVRVAGRNPIVASTYGESWLLQTGRYVVQPHDTPLYQVKLDPDGRMAVVSLPAGEPNGISEWNPL